MPVINEVKGKGLTRELMEVINDPDVIQREPTSRLMELNEILTKNNLIIYKWVTTIGGTKVPRDQGLGIGEYYAWQLPIYRIIKQPLT